MHSCTQKWNSEQKIVLNFCQPNQGLYSSGAGLNYARYEYSSTITNFVNAVRSKNVSALGTPLRLFSGPSFARAMSMEQSTLKLRTIISGTSGRRVHFHWHQRRCLLLLTFHHSWVCIAIATPLIYSNGYSFGIISISTSASTLQLVSLSSRGRATTSRPITSTTREPVISGLKYQCPIR